MMKKKKINLAYICFFENEKHPIIRTQVLDLLKNIASDSSHDITLLWFQRLDHTIRFRKNHRQFRHELRKSGIRLIKAPVLARGNPSSIAMLPAIMMQMLVAMIWVQLRYKIRIFHCRSYYPGLAGALFSKLGGTETIFDTRSPYPEENVAAMVWKPDSLNYRFWKLVEAWIIKNSTATVATTEALGCELDIDSTPIIVIPNNVSVLPSERFAKQKNDEDLSPNTKGKLCYIGTLGHWNSPRPYIEFFRRLPTNKYELLFVTPKECVGELKNNLSDSAIDTESVHIRSAALDTVPYLIYNSDVGLQLMNHRDLRLSIKVVEYLAAGIPVIVSENVVGAAEIINLHSVGFVLKSDFQNMPGAIEFIDNVRSNRDFWRKKCQKVARENFDTNIVASKYCELYKKLTV